MGFLRVITGVAATSGLVLAAATGGWGRAEQVPGSAAQAGKGGQARVTSVSCASPGDCVAGGYYLVPISATESVDLGFIVTQTDGRWGKAQPVPGLAGISPADAIVTAVSCPSVGNCSVGGSDGPNLGDFNSGWVDSEVHGKWRQAEAVPGLLTIDVGDQATLTSMSCASAGNCSAGGSYANGTPDEGGTSGYVVSEVHGTWRNALEVPGLESLNSVDDSPVLTVSCARSGDCAAGGFYLDGGNSLQSFVADQKNGRWGLAIAVPGVNGGAAVVETSSVSCPAPGRCVAGGDDAQGDGEGAFVVSQRNGTWGQGAQVRGATALKPDGQANLDMVSCASPGNCAAVGHAFSVTVTGTGPTTSTTAFVVSEVKGAWGVAEKVPGLPALNLGNNADLVTVSCPSPGNCAAGGYYANRQGVQQAMVTTEVNGAWGQAQAIPGLAGLAGPGGASAVSSVSCAAAGQCSAGGVYLPHNIPADAFVVSRS